jgi:hypothetical protein
MAAAGVYWLHPFFAGNPAYSLVATTTSTVTNGTTVTTSANTQAPGQAFDSGGLDVAPWVSLGYGWDNGTVIRARWWYYQEAANEGVVNGDTSGATVISSASPGGLTLRSPGTVLAAGVGADALGFHSDLQMDVMDTEVARAVGLGPWTLELAGGARYAHLAQHYVASLANAGVNAQGFALTDSGELSFKHHFDGAGPLAALGAHWCLGHTGLSLFGTARTSLLFGCTDADASLGSASSKAGPNATFVGTISRSSDVNRSDFLPVVELELGAAYQLDFGRIRPFFETGVVGQSWFNAGNASALGTTLGLLGLSTTVGVNF